MQSDVHFDDVRVWAGFWYLNMVRVYRFNLVWHVIVQVELLTTSSEVNPKIVAHVDMVMARFFNIWWLDLKNCRTYEFNIFRRQYFPIDSNSEWVLLSIWLQEPQSLNCNNNRLVSHISSNVFGTKIVYYDVIVVKIGISCIQVLIAFPKLEV